MKKIISSVMALIIVLVSFVNARAGEKEEGWMPTAEISVAVHNAYVDDYSGAAYYRNTMFFQSAMVGLDKSGTGCYFQADNYSPSEQETRETDFYVGFYTRVVGVKIDAGYGRYWVREAGALDFNGVYAEITFPSPIWKIIPFVKAEYRFAERMELADGSKVSLDGFLYQGGIKREFQIHERVNLTTEVSVGGNTGIYGRPAENLSFAREKLEVLISIMTWMKIKASAMTQQNLGLREGIAADTDRIFVSGAVVLTF
jgi:hypothetical protein